MTNYQKALNATEDHLRALQSTGTRFLNVRAETLFALQQPAPEIAVRIVKEGMAAPTPAPIALEAIPVPPARQEPRPTDSGVVGRGSCRAEPVTRPDLLPTEKEAAMADLQKRTLGCVKCPHLVSARRNVVFGVGDIRARLMFVGEAPGADEDRLGEPFVGAAGQLLTKIIVAMGLTREKVYIANILKCRPDTPGQTSGNRKPTPEEMKTCLPWLQEQINLIHPEVMVALGATAVEGLLGAAGGITRLRGKFQSFQGIPVMPTFHPSYLLHNQAITEKRKVWEDMLQVMEKLALPISGKQRGFFLKG